VSSRSLEGSKLDHEISVRHEVPPSFDDNNNDTDRERAKYSAGDLLDGRVMMGRGLSIN
jgi:hypothetical protein